MRFEDFKIYLPKYLSAKSTKELFEGLKDFPENIDARVYTRYLSDSNVIYQGDGIQNLLVLNLPSTKIDTAPSVILSNTCDMDLSHERNYSAQIVYSPIFNLNKYRNKLLNKSGKTEDQIDSHILSIKKQMITQIFYLPEYENILDESIVFFDRVYNLPNAYIDRNNLNETRLFTLSDYGFYLFLLKLSVHFTRIQDSVERKSLNM